MQHRLTCDPFHLLRREQPDRTWERWEQALSELENARLAQIQATTAG